MPLFSPRVYNFFTRIVNGNIENREQHKIVRPDMIDLLLKAKNNKLKHDEEEKEPETGFAVVEESQVTNKVPKPTVTNEDIASQALLFFFAGFDSVSSLICYMAHELAVNPEVQAKLLHEVDETREKFQGNVTYEALMNMKYMDMVVSGIYRHIFIY